MGPIVEQSKLSDLYCGRGDRFQIPAMAGAFFRMVNLVDAILLASTLGNNVFSLKFLRLGSNIEGFLGLLRNSS